MREQKGTQEHTCPHAFLCHSFFSLVKAQEDIAGGQKREDEVEEEGEGPYNEENIEQVGYSSGEPEEMHGAPRHNKSVESTCIVMHFQSFKSQP